MTIGAARRARRPQEVVYLFFLIRSAVCIAVVYMLVSPETPGPAMRRPSTGAVAPSAGPGEKLDAAKLALARAGGDALGAAMRDYCLASPRDCVDILRRRALQR